jgi:DNA-binding transcriptional MerR regulator
MAADGFTIGEVLNQLKEDFEDITISKIRFLESEGLIYPDRTESGYRKFTEDDVERLRFILIAQRDHFLPLKVIRERLEEHDEALADGAASDGSAADPTAGPTLSPSQLQAVLEQAMSSGVEASLLESPPSAVHLTLRDFCEATGLDPTEVKALREYGIIAEHSQDEVAFDGDDLIAARAARDLLRLGLEPRHLRMYVQFVDREVALFEQLATPLLRQRNPEARRQASRQLDKLAGMTSTMKRQLLARALRRYVHLS